MIRILIVSTDKDSLENLKTGLEENSVQISWAESCDKVLSRTKEESFDLIITDQTMPKITGENLAKKLMEIRPDIPVIIGTGYSEAIDKEKAKAMGIRAFVMKPIVISELANTIRNVLDK